MANTRNSFRLYYLAHDHFLFHITILDEDELKRFKKEVYATYSNGERKYKQADAYILMRNTGMRLREALGLKNSDIDLDNKQMHIQTAVKEIYNREGTKATDGFEI